MKILFKWSPRFAGMSLFPSILGMINRRKTVALFRQMNKERNLRCILCFYKKEANYSFIAFIFGFWNGTLRRSISVMFKTILLPFTIHNKFLFDFIYFIIITDDTIITGGKSWLLSLLKQSLLFTLVQLRLCYSNQGCKTQTQLKLHSSLTRLNLSANCWGGCLNWVHRQIFWYVHRPTARYTWLYKKLPVSQCQVYWAPSSVLLFG